MTRLKLATRGLWKALAAQVGSKAYGRASWGLLAVLGGLLALALLLLPLSVAAASNSDIIAILNAGIDGLVKLVKLAYCAAGVGALC